MALQRSAPRLRGMPAPRVRAAGRSAQGEEMSYGCVNASCPSCGNLCVGGGCSAVAQLCARQARASHRQQAQFVALLFLARKGLMRVHKTVAFCPFQPSRCRALSLCGRVQALAPRQVFLGGAHQPPLCMCTSKRRRRTQVDWPMLRWKERHGILHTNVLSFHSRPCPAPAAS